MCEPHEHNMKQCAKLLRLAALHGFTLEVVATSMAEFRAGKDEASALVSHHKHGNERSSRTCTLSPGARMTGNSRLTAGTALEGSARFQFDERTRGKRNIVTMRAGKNHGCSKHEE